MLNHVDALCALEHPIAPMPMATVCSTPPCAS